MMQFATALTLLLAVVFSSGSSCEQDTVAGSNNLDRPTDLILVEDGENGDSYVVIANPRAKALRFFNITEGLFVAAPNLAFPLATITGTGTRTLHRSAENTELFFALDTVEGEIYSFRSRTTDQLAFTHARAPFRTQPNPTHVAVHYNDAEPASWEIWVASTQPNELHGYRLENDGLGLSRSASASLASATTALALEQSGKLLFVSQAATEGSLEVRMTGAAEALAAIDLPHWPEQLRVRPSRTLGSGFFEIWYLTQGGAHLGLVLYDETQNLFQHLGKTETPAPVRTLYLPDNDSETQCCSGMDDALKSGQWLTTVDAAGNLFYWQWRMNGTEWEAIQLELDIFDANQDDPEASLNCIDASGDAIDACGAVTLVPVSESQSPWDGWELDTNLRWTFEGAPDGLKERSVRFRPESSDFVPTYGTFPSGLGLLQGDSLEVEIVGDTETCNGSYPIAFESIDAQSVAVGILGTQLTDCLGDETQIRLSLRPVDAFLLEDDRHGEFGIVRKSDGLWSTRLGQWQMSLTPDADVGFTQGDQAQINLVKNMNRVGLFLSQGFSYQSGGFGTFGNYASAMVGGDVKIKDAEGEAQVTHRVYLISETGSLFELLEGETDLTNVFSYK